MEDDAEWRREAAALADELRATAEVLAVSEPSRESLASAHELARALRARLEGRPRLRWYDESPDGMPPADGSHSAYVDMSPIRGRLNPVAPPLRVARITLPDGSPAIEGRARLGRTYEGPPHGVHGGWVAALFDDVLGAAQGLAPPPGVTAKLTVRFRDVTPIDEELRLRAWVTETKGRRLVARATCHAGEVLTADAEGLFVRVDWSALHVRMRDRRTPEEG
jgi:acyl-coenzyme A thioesterase PaaI-like protein